MKYKSAIFDFDSTLVSIEGIDELARIKGVYEEVSLLTRQAMDGVLTFEDVFYKRLELIQPSEEDLETVSQLYLKHLVEGAEKLIRNLHEKHIEVFVISGGYLQAILTTTEHLGIPSSRVFAIKLSQDGIGGMTKVSQNNILTSTSGKKDLLEQLDLPKPNVYIGDGITDAQTKPLVDCFIGFGGVSYRPQVDAMSDIYIRSSNLYSVYNYLNL